MHPQQPFPQQPPPPIGPPPPPVPPRRPVGLLFAALLAGALLGAVGGAAAVALAGDDDASGARADALAACGALERFDHEKYYDEGQDGIVHLHRWSGAHTLSRAAGEADSRYLPLAENIDEVRLQVNQQYEFTDAAKRHLDEARRLCGEL
ncbi:MULTISPECIES: hypothetical protein [unclassified Streptomyces]|uniref:hypothetical protein n=1 Tax=unclassified Streptomyces TaxID=2593676 RepID=UPI0022B6DAEE|nr:MULTISPECIES: hypothetical protein [unclassified Streptomyces]MCZ7416363.1 hypothetical protein [Streptomyces sp. WMMC897]MCZ7433827.1 hypothetical protein [Streptomyces sp. WMMC1477]